MLNFNQPTPTSAANQNRPTASNIHQQQEMQYFLPPTNMSSSGNQQLQSSFFKNKRVASPAIAAPVVHMNRPQPSPGTQKRPEHLRLNNL